MDTKNYIRTDNPDGYPDGSILLVPIKEPVKVSKRFVPEEGEEYYVVNCDGGISSFQSSDDYIDKGCLAMGNVYRTEAEATKARDKQLALVRIQNYIADNDLGKEFVDGEANYSIFYKHQSKDFCSHYWDSYEESPIIGYLKSEEACTQVIENCKEDLLIVWGRK